MEKNIKRELVEFVDEYNRVFKRNFYCEDKDVFFVIYTEGFVSKTFVDMFMERFSDKGLSFVVSLVLDKLEFEVF